MSKLRKTILIIGILVVAVAASLGTALALYATGSMKTDTVELEYVLREKEKVYDGTPLKLDDSLNDVSLQKGKLAQGHTAKYEFSGSQTNVGTSMSDMTVKIYDADGFNVTGDYSIKVVGAPLTVTPKSISVELPSQKVVYNGSKVLFNEYNITENADGELAELCSGHKIYGSTDASLMNVGDTLPADLTPLIFDVAGNDVTANYEIEFTPGEIEVVPRHISVRPVSKEKVYDGVTMYADEIECIDGSLVEGQYVRFEINENYENKITDAGTVETEITKLRIFDVINGEEEDVTENYEIDTFETGVLTVNKRLLTVTAKSAVFTYNGAEQSLMNETEALSVEGLADGEELISVSYAGALTNVGVTDNIIIGLLLTGSEDNYERQLISGKIEIKPFELHVQTNSAEKYYDGQPLSSDGFATAPDLANDKHKIGIGGDGVLPEITDAGAKENAYSVAVLDGNGDDCTANYAITYTYGTLTVKKLPVKVTLNAEEHITYDGSGHRPTLGSPEEGNSPYFDVQPALDEGEEVDAFTLDYSHFEVVSDSRIMRDKGEYRYTVKFSDKSFDNNYTLEVPESGYLIIDARAVKITTGSTRKPYSGNKLTDESYVLDGTLVLGHNFKLPLTYPSIINVGKIYNEYVLGVEDENGVDVTGNYELSYNYGVLTVSELPLSVTLKSYTNAQAFTYSGKAVSLTAADAITAITTTESGVNLSEIIDKDDFAVVIADNIIDVGTDYTYTVKIGDREFAKNFNLTITGNNGKLTVKALPVTVTVKDVERVYNGTEHIIDAYAAVHSISNTTTGLTRDDLIISYDNAAAEHINASNYGFSVYICDAKKRNYDLKVENLNNANDSGAMLKIRKFDLEVITADVAFVYNGELRSSNKFTCGALANSAHKIRIATLPDDMPAVCNVWETAKNELEFVINDASGNNVSGNYDVNVISGMLSVTPCPVTITTGTQTAVYSGNALTDGTATANIELFNGHTIESPAEENLPSQLGVGSCKNEFNVDIKGDQGRESFKDNYSITYIFGTLTVTARDITVTTGSAERVYNGTALSKTDGITINGLPEDTGLNFYAELKDGASECSITNVGEVPNRFDCTVYFAGDDVTSNFNVHYVYGTLKVTPLTVTLGLNDFSDLDLEYDGTAKKFAVADAIITILADGVEYYLADAGSPDDPDAGVDGYADGESEGLTFVSSDFTIVYPSLILDAGTYTYTVKFADDNYAKNFVLDQIAPTVRVKKMQVEVYLKDYNGEDKFTFDNNVKTLEVGDAVTAILNVNGDLVDASLLKPEDFTVVYPTEMRNAGDYKYTVRITYDYRAKNFNFDETTYGEVTVDRFAVSAVLNNYKEDYSGKEFAIPADALTLLTDTALIYASDFAFKLEGGEPALNAGTYTYSAEIADKTFARNFDVTIDVSDETANGTIVIEPLKVNATLNPVTLTYNGSVQKVDAASAVEIDSELVKASDFTFTVMFGGAEAEIRNAGDYTFEVTLTTPNFTFGDDGDTVDGGTITVDKLQVTVTLNNFIKEYDGEEYELTPDTAIYAVSGNLLNAYDFDITYDDGLADHSDAGNYTMSVSLTADKADEADNIELKTLNGKISISKRTVSLTTPTETFEYNGEAQSATEPVLTGALAGHSARVGAGGWAEITDVGTKRNESEYEIYYINDDGDETDVTANYKIVYSYGTLTVTQRALTVTTDSADKPYDGTPLKKGTFTQEGLVDGHSITVPAEADLPGITDAGKVKNAYAVTVKSGVRDVTANYAITYVYGDLEISAVDVTVTLRNVTKPYTGADIEVSVDEAIDSVNDLTDTDFNVVTNQTVVNAGTYTFTVELADETKARNYKINVNGSNTLTVTKLNLAVTLKDVENAEYNGNKHGITAANVVSVGTNVDGITANSFTFIYSDMINVGDYEYTAEIKDETLRGNYNLNVIGGNYKIVPTKITVNLKNYVETYGNCNFTVDVYDAILSIEGTYGNLLSKSDFAPKYVESLRKAGIYTYEVEIANVEKSKNFTVTLEDGNFTINTRKLAVVFTGLELTQREFNELYGGDEYAANFDVRASVSLSTATPVANGDSFRVISAVAEGLGDNILGLYTIANYELTNADCYEFVNLDGATPLTARLKILN